MRNFGDITYKKKGRKSLTGIFDPFVHKEEMVKVPRIPQNGRMSCHYGLEICSSLPEKAYLFEQIIRVGIIKFIVLPIQQNYITLLFYGIRKKRGGK